MGLNTGIFSSIIRLSVQGAERYKRQIDQTAAATKRAAIAADTAGSSFSDLAGSFTAIAWARGAKQAMAGFIKPAAEMQTQIQGIAALTGMGGEALKKFEQKAIDVAGKVRFDPNSLTAALLRLRQVTGSANAALQSLEPTAFISMASAGRINLEKSVELTGDLAKGFGLHGAEITDAMERIFALSKRTGVGIETFTERMYRLAQAAKTGKQSFDQTMQLYALMSRIERTPATASTMTSRTMQFLLDPRGQELLMNAGIEVYDKTGQKIRPIMELMTDLHKKYQKEGLVTSTLIQDVWSKKSMRGIESVMAAMSQGLEGPNGVIVKGEQLVKLLGDDMLGSTGEVTRAVNEMMKTLESQTGLAGDAFQKLLISLGKEMLPAITTIVKGLKAGIENLVQALDANPFIKWLFTRAIIGGLMATSIVAIGAALWGIKRVTNVVLGNLFSIGSTTAASASVGATALNTRLLPALAKVNLATKGILGLLGKLAIIYPVYSLAKTATEMIVGTKEEQLKESMEKDLNRMMAENILRGGHQKALTRGFSMADIARAEAIRSGIAMTGMEGGGFFAGRAGGMSDLAVKTGGQMLLHWAKARAESDKIKKNMELAGDKTKDIYKNLELGSDALNKMLKRAEGAGTYEPPVVKMAAFNAMQQRLSAVAGGKGREAMMAKRAVSALQTGRALIAKAAKGEIEPNELATLMQAMGDVGSVGTHLGLVLGPNAVGSSLLKRFQENVVKQVGKMGTAENAAFMEGLLRMSGGDAMTPNGLRTPTKLVPGGRGSLPVGGKHISVPYTAYSGTPGSSNLSGPMSVAGKHDVLSESTMGDFFGTSPSGFSNAQPGYLAGIEKQRRQSEQQLLAKLTGREVSMGLEGALSRKVLKVEIVSDGRDPMGPQSSSVFTGAE